MYVVVVLFHDEQAYNDQHCRCDCNDNVDHYELKSRQDFVNISCLRNLDAISVLEIVRKHNLIRDEGIMVCPLFAVALENEYYSTYSTV